MSHAFTIPLSGLKDGRHTLEFDIDKEFFEKFEESEIKEGKLVAKVEVEKRRTHADLSVRIAGSVIICCDRCLEMFSMPLDCENRLLVKLGKNMDGDDPDIVSLSVDEHELDLSQHFYDYIHLALPIKRVHPDQPDGKSTCDPEMLKKLEEMRAEEENNTDPRWDDLKRLMNDN